MTENSKTEDKPKKGEKTFLFRVLAFFVIGFMRFSARFKVIDGHKLPKRGAYVISPNHMSNIDPLAIAVAVWKLGRAPRFLAKASLFKVPVLGAALRGTDQIMVQRDKSQATGEPIAEAQQIVDKECVVIVYPEGTLTRDPELWPMRGKTGAVRLARQAGIPVIPVAHWGANELMPRYTNRLRIFPRKTIQIKIGDPIDFSVPTGTHSDAADLKVATEKLMTAITNLEADLRGEEPPAKRWDPAEHGQSDSGKF